MIPKVDDWGIQISLACVSCGKEEEYRARRKRNVENGYWLEALGYYDVLEIRLIADIEELYNTTLDETVLEYTSFPCFTWKNLFDPDSFKTAVETMPILVLSLIKIEQSLIMNYGAMAERAVAGIFRTRDPNSFPFINVGHSEICLLQMGNNIETVLDNVREIRRATNAVCISKYIYEHFKVPKKDLEKVPGIQNSTSIISVCSPDDDRFKTISGYVRPTLLANCHPSFEEEISKCTLCGNPTATDIYGKDDLVFRWESDVEFKDLVSDILKMRKTYGQHDKVLYKSHTRISSSKAISNPLEKLEKPTSLGEIQVISPELAKKLDELNPTLKNLIMETASRFKGYLRLGYLQSSYLDMIGIFSFIENKIDEIKEMATKSPWKKRFIEMELFRALDYCNHGIYQRYAGLESHLESVSYLPFPQLCGISRIVNAASAVPLSIMSRIQEGKDGWQTWAGFVCFGVNNAYQYDLAQVISYPGEYIYRPVEMWWVITHEICHILYEMLNESVFKSEANKQINMILKHFKGFYSKELLDHYAEETFAGWFDYKYIHRGDGLNYIRLIWNLWIELNSVWKHKSQYLARTFIIYYYSDIRELGYLSRTDVVMYREEIYRRIEDMLNVLKSTIPNFDHYESELGTEGIKKTATLIEDFFLPLTNIFENTTDEVMKTWGERISASISNQESQSKKIQAGTVLCSDDIEPVSISIRLSGESLLRERVSLQETAAFIMSMWHYYVTSNRPEVT